MGGLAGDAHSQDDDKGCRQAPLWCGRIQWTEMVNWRGQAADYHSHCQSLHTVYTAECQSLHIMYTASTMYAADDHCHCMHTVYTAAVRYLWKSILYDLHIVY